jgi:ubiquitin-conjugating enzyme E2 G1
MNQQETADERWRPIHSIESILLSVISMLNDPNIESPANLDASNEFKSQRDVFNKKVRVLAAKSVDYL